jgi:deoxyribonuclease-4
VDTLKPRGPLLGAHVPVSGGLAKAPPRAREIGAEAAQIFTRNQLQWRADPIRAEEAAAFKDALGLHPLRRLVAHGSYLVNLASPDPLALLRSREAFLADMQRCHALGVTHLIFHAGAHLGAGEDAGLRTVAQSLDWLLERSDGLAVRPVIEVTAGQGSCLAYRFEHLAAILERTRGADRIGVCLDTCHLWAAGHDILSPGGYRRTFAEFERLVGLEKLEVFHLNDAKQPRGSRLDRHERIGKGWLGRATFCRLMRDGRFRNVPMILETPAGMQGWGAEIRLLRALARRARRGR